MSLTSGTRLGPYEIVAPIGAGGMGEVYRARDTTLQRDVAIKTLPPVFAGDPERLARFAREAQTLAALNHPNVAQIYGVEGPALVMELVEGEDLAQQVARGPVALDEALPIARQIAAALEAAHEQGIVHRDLKPANIKVRADGTVKVLDFGLAKALEAPGANAGSAATDANSPTVLSPGRGPTFPPPLRYGEARRSLGEGGRSGVSQAGVILGTASYMSPEQAKGKPVDRRADIWAFGCVLFEMLAGRPVFSGETITEILAAVVRDEPDWTALPASTPPSIARLLRRCLTRDPKERLSDIGVARLEIRDAGAEAPAGDAPLSVQRRTRAGRPWWMLAAGVVAGALVAGAATWRTRPVPATPPALRLTIDWPEDQTWTGPSGPGVVMSPDGTHIVYVATTERAGSQIYLRDLRRDETRAVSATDTPYNPFFSPDSTQVGFIAGGKLWRAPVAGGVAFEIGPVDANDRGVAWSPDGFIYSGGRSGISRIAESGGAREAITTVDQAAGELSHRFPALVPGRGLLFMIVKGSLDDSRIAVVDLSTRKWRVLMDRTGHFPLYAPTGHLLYLRTGVLMAAPFDASRLEVTGPSAPVMPGILYNNGGASHFSVSSTGTLAYVADPGMRTPADLLWVDRTGRATPADLPRGPYTRPVLSPDGTRVALEQSSVQEKQSVVVWDFGRRALSTITRDTGVSEYPIWLPDGTGVVFTSRPQLGALGRLYRQRADGVGTPAQVTTGSLSQVFASSGEYAGSVTPDGTKVLYSEVGTSTAGIKALDLATGQTEMVVPQGRTPRFSPDGRWLAYRSSESAGEIYVSPYPNAAAARWQVSTGYAGPPRWSRDSTELFYRGLGSNRTHMYVVKVGGAATLAGIRPQLLTNVPDSGGPDGSGLEEFDVASDGRFLMLRGLPQKPPVPHVIVNWFEVLKRAVPGDGR